MRNLKLMVLAASLMLGASAFSGTVKGPLNVGQVWDSSTWSARGSCAAANAGYFRRITDVGVNAGGSLFVCDGTYWHAFYPITLAMSTSTSTANTSASELGHDGTNGTGDRRTTIPAGLLRSCAYLIVRAQWGKNGTTDTVTARVRVGTAGASPDTAVLNTAVLTTTNRAQATETWLYVQSTTSLRLGADSTSIAGFTGAARTTTMPVTYSVGDIDAGANIVSLSTQMSGTTDSGQIYTFNIECKP